MIATIPAPRPSFFQGKFFIGLGFERDNFGINSLPTNLLTPYTLHIIFNDLNECSRFTAFESGNVLVLNGL